MPTTSTSTPVLKAWEPGFDTKTARYTMEAGREREYRVEYGPEGELFLIWDCGARVGLGDLAKRRKTLEWFDVMGALPKEMRCIMPVEAITDQVGEFVSCDGEKIGVYETATDAREDLPGVTFKLSDVRDLFLTTTSA